MAYQGVSVPRFYCDNNLFLDVVGYTAKSPVYNLSPSSNLTTYNTIDGFYYTALGSNPVIDYNYIFMLGHNAHSQLIDHTWTTSGQEWSFFGDRGGDDYIDLSAQVNGGWYTLPAYDGWTLHTWNTLESDFTYWVFGWDNSTTGAPPLSVASFSMGRYYDMINAPNLSLTMDIEYGSTKEVTAYNGATFSNTMWSSQPKWGNLGAWELNDGNTALQSLSRSGRRVWQLTFSYMDDGSLWGSNQSLTFGAYVNEVSELTFDEEDIDYSSPSNGAFTYNLLTDSNFFSLVWSRTLGGTLPFVFQPDNKNFNNDGFAICRFRDNSLKATQTAVNVYDISLVIEETW